MKGEVYFMQCIVYYEKNLIFWESVFMKKIALSAICLGVGLGAPVWAERSHDECGRFHLQISNTTSNSCILTSIQVIHGNLITSPPSSIMPNDSKVFDMEQTIYGPSITLNYLCGEENISFKSSQKLCVLEAGDVTGEVLHPLPVNTNASYTAINGSYFWNKPGNIIWRIMKGY